MLCSTILVHTTLARVFPDPRKSATENENADSKISPD